MRFKLLLLFTIFSLSIFLEASAPAYDCFGEGNHYEVSIDRQGAEGAGDLETERVGIEFAVSRKFCDTPI